MTQKQWHRAMYEALLVGMSIGWLVARFFDGRLFT